MNKPHKHAELIKAWADGAEIEWRSNPNFDNWHSVTSPGWDCNLEYRIKDPYRELKDAFADGAKLERKSPNENEWHEINDPQWLYPPECYRIKPEEEPVEISIRLDSKTIEFIHSIAKTANLTPDQVVNVMLAMEIERNAKSS